MKKKFRFILIGIIALLLASAGGFLLWATNPAQPETQALESLRSDEIIRFEQVNNWLVFTPTNATPTTGLIFYPGGRVDYRAYALHAREIAAGGFTVVVVPMPLNLAVLGINRAGDVVEAFPQIDQWVIGGHSLGGAMAAEFFSTNLDLVDGLVLWAAYPAANTDLSGVNQPVLSVFASNDGLATLEDIADSKTRLPDHTLFFEITGGNHAGFGWYGQQNGDGVASLSQIEQQNQIVEATVSFMQLVEQNLQLMSNETGDS